MHDDKVNENWDKFIEGLTEAPRGDWGGWSDSAEQAGPHDEQPAGRDDEEEVGRITLRVSKADVRTIQAAIEQRLDSSGILHHILDELGTPSRDEGDRAAGPDGPDGPYIIGPTSR